jgi:polar amino acid transport system substrate-binding protein
MPPFVVIDFATFVASALLATIVGIRRMPLSSRFVHTFGRHLSLSTCVCACLCTYMCANAVAAPAETALYTLEWPPYSTADQEHKKGDGISIDIVNELMRRSGMAASAPKVVPWARALAVTELQSNSCVVPVARTGDRESKYQWIGPIGQSEWAFFARSKDHLTINRIDDARSYRIGTIIGDLSVSYLQEKKIQLDLTTSDALNIKKLEAKRIDLWSSARLPGLEFLRENKVDDIEPVFTYLKVDLYLACQRTMEKSDVARLNDMLKAMYADGTIRNIYGRYGYENEWQNPMQHK